MKLTGKLMILAVCLLGLVSSSWAEWTEIGPMPTSRFALATCAVDGRIYAIGGSDAAAPQRPVATVEEYDTATGTWAARAPMPSPRSYLAASAVNGRIYAIGGGQWTGPPYLPTLTTVEEYDPAADAWVERAPMPTARDGIAGSSSVVDGKIYVIGGTSGTATAPFSTVEEYDPATDTWTARAPMPTARLDLSTCVVNGRIYAIGGSVSLSALGNSTSAVEEYDPATDNWTTKEPMPTGALALSACAVAGRIYAIGGNRSWSGTAYSTVYVYDPGTDTWAEGPDMPGPRMYLATAVVNGTIYAMGGSSQAAPYVPLSAAEMYAPGATGIGALSWGALKAVLR